LLFEERVHEALRLSAGRAGTLGGRHGGDEGGFAPADAVVLEDDLVWLALADAVRGREGDVVTSRACCASPSLLMLRLSSSTGSPSGVDVSPLDDERKAVVWYLVWGVDVGNVGGVGYRHVARRVGYVSAEKERKTDDDIAWVYGVAYIEMLVSPWCLQMRSDSPRG
jgi:hypothetical protein